MQASQDDARWTAVLERDSTCDGAFVFAVRTTRIYCRPGCPARRPKPEHVVFFETAAEARAAGFRPCLRCRPDAAADATGEAVLGACQLIGESETPPPLSALAEAAGMSRFHFQRVFKREVGMSPKQYADTRRQARLRETLPGATSVTEALYEAGYDSAARFYVQAHRALGMPASDYKAGGRGQAIWYALTNSIVGRVLIAGTARGLCAIFFGDGDESLETELRARFPNAHLVAAGEDLRECVAETVAFIDLPKGAFRLPLDVQGTAFQHKVWKALRDIPFGETATYAEIAERIGSPAATRAVANACGANPAAVAVPCHRVLRSDGSLGGYRWGVDRKRELLRRERGESN
ncbi:bifunctional DNA-binding transcriptional regulator/O6-methylguanine-DNA methyltransferase Ada [Dichotomicrobium thermohalophilum]|uniref:methylated-DNA--[protein]-cysteine S-methyltransferase n=1 Tax=Dichotomicrobium thermohalophilum TaxID=933063 RepID=A0A397QFH6_9HYPH|nr:bifunctional DNA-binding transcriptional regulator/O6-methylguanine-DNA methyltransferase Ada [Dichotomicrobium thermohalophilum]RIA56804.1 AraC family transcriptional regulator of adaptative response/methylated-DNA-[protein]-cysteine methyltransferase [Dichotomicrobium thermohalophilum]